MDSRRGWQVVLAITGAILVVLCVYIDIFSWCVYTVLCCITSYLVQRVHGDDALGRQLAHVDQALLRASGRMCVFVYLFVCWSLL